MVSKPLPVNSNPTFAPDYPGAIVYPAHPANYYRPEEHGGVPNRPRGWVLHTPEEPADDYEVTPRYFAEAPRQASTHYYLDSDGDVYQMVPESCAAIANGVLGKPYPSWADPRTSLNWQSVNVEIEGYGHSIHLSMPVGGAQWNGLVNLIRHRAGRYGIPLDREHIIGHYQVSNARSDPGALFPWDALIADLNSEDVMRKEHDAWGLIDAVVPPGQRLTINPREVFGVPPEARWVNVEYLPKKGYGVVLHGTSQAQAGRFGWAWKPGVADGYGSAPVALDANGCFYLWAEDKNNPIELFNAHCRAWW